jgi:hypothetical protein
VWLAIPTASTRDIFNCSRFSECDGLGCTLGADTETHFEIDWQWNLGVRSAGIFLERFLEVF